MLTTLVTLLATATLLINASPISRRQITCATGVHVIHARGSTQSQADDSTLSVVDLLAKAIPGSTESDVDYPAAIISSDSFYSTSVGDGIDNLVSQIKSYVAACGSSSRIVLLGYSQGGNVVSSALAGGIVRPIPLSTKYKKNIVGAAVFGDPTHTAGQKYTAGTADGSGIFKRVVPSTTLLNTYSSVFRSYCAEKDFFCDAGGDLNVHYAEVDTYAQTAANFIIGLVNKS